MQFRFFVGDPLNTEVRRGQPEDFLFSRPLRLVVLTSIRDVGASDRCGSFIDVRCPHEGEWGSSIQLQCRKRYLKGALETLVEETTKPEGRLFGRFHLVGIVVDDVPQRDGVEAAGYTIVPQPCSSNENQKRRWILDGSLKVAPEEKCVRDLVWHVPSEWRKLPLEDEERKIGKWRWEGKVEAICLGLNADIVLSDHLMVVLERLVESEALRGKLLNIHPGITLEKDESCMRGKRPTADALEKGKRRFEVLSLGMPLNSLRSLDTDKASAQKTSLEKDNPAHCSRARLGSFFGTPSRLAQQSDVSPDLFHEEETSEGANGNADGNPFPLAASSSTTLTEGIDGVFPSNLCRGVSGRTGDWWGEVGVKDSEKSISECGDDQGGSCCPDCWYPHLFASLGQRNPIQKNPSRDANESVAPFSSLSQRFFMHGASLHRIEREVDGGPVVCDGKGTPVLPWFDETTLRWVHYQNSKCPVLLAGLQHFAALYTI